MTDQQQKLTALLKKIEAGREPGFDDTVSIIGFTTKRAQKLTRAAFNGSINAVWELHDDLRQGREYSIAKELTSQGDTPYCNPGRYLASVYWEADEQAGIPLLFGDAYVNEKNNVARAYLAAIIRLLIYREEKETDKEKNQ